MKIYILTDEPYHDNEMYYGAYTTREKAEAAMGAFVVDPSTNWRPVAIVELPLDEPAAVVPYTRGAQ